MRCNKCKNPIKWFWSYCPKCGNVIENKPLLYCLTGILIIIIFALGIGKNMYGSMIIISLIINASFLYTSFKKQKYSNYEIGCLLAYELFGIILGAKLLTYITDFNRCKSISFLKIGLSSYGAVIGAFLMLFIYQLQFKKDKKVLLINCMLPLPLMYSVGKIGCFIAGCCYGIEYSGPFNIVYNNSLDAPSGVSLFPIQFLESVVFLFIFVCLYFNKKLSDINKCGLILIICGSAKFLLDFLRASHTNTILSVNQMISIIIAIIGLLILITNKTSIRNK